MLIFLLFRFFISKDSSLLEFLLVPLLDFTKFCLLAPLLLLDYRDWRLLATRILLDFQKTEFTRFFYFTRFC